MMSAQAPCACHDGKRRGTFFRDHAREWNLAVNARDCNAAAKLPLSRKCPLNFAQRIAALLHRSLLLATSSHFTGKRVTTSTWGRWEWGCHEG
jgi:hypothetical protein